MRKNLVVARVGASSLHGSWIDPRQPRDWDLVLCPYQPVPPAPAGEYEVADVIPGPKWTGLRRLLEEWDGWRAYDHVWLPDDDLLADQRTIGSMFEIAGALGLDLFAPALRDDSHFAHFITMENRRFCARRTGFVEIMMPGFSRAALERLLPTLALSETGWGWGLDSLWPKLLGYEGVGIIDATPVLHTRPVGQMRDGDLARRVLAESDHILASFACRQTHVTFEAVGHDLAPLALSPEQLLAELVRGYQYLIDRDPRVLTWLGVYQRSHFGSPDYPAAGTPAAGVPVLAPRAA